ncbi:MAG: hypothetical protein R3B52_00905 [Candidatus Paceibacterota bacterium]
MPISKRQWLRKLIPAGAIDITHSSRGSSTFADKIPARYVGAWCLVPGERGHAPSTLRGADVSRGKDFLEKGRYVIVLVTMEGKILLFPRSASVLAGKVLKEFAPKGCSEELGIHIGEVDLSAGELMEARMQMIDVRSRPTDLVEDCYPTIKVGGPSCRCGKRDCPVCGFEEPQAYPDPIPS